VATKVQGTSNIRTLYSTVAATSKGPFSGGPLGSTSGGDGGGVEVRIAKLEAHVEHIQSDIAEIKADTSGIRKDLREDFRILFGCLIFVALGLTAIMAHGFHWL